jgi:hypothetical protein
MLCQFSDEFLQSRSMDELLRIESTSLRVKDAERTRENEDKLSQNKLGLDTKFYEVQAGRDNRWSDLHPARYLPGAAATAKRQYTRAREVLGLSSPPPIGCYDMQAVGMGGFVQNKGWIELGTMGSNRLKVEQFNINNAAKTSSSKKEDEPYEMKDIAEFTLALRTLRSAAQFACNWNFSYLALENFFYSNRFFVDELKDDSNPARTLCQFSDFIISENANLFRDGSGFLTTGELTAYWNSFVGARVQASSAPAKPAPAQQAQQAQNQQAAAKPNNRKRKFPFVDICGKWNTGNCPKAPGACYNFRGIQMKHICNWRDPNNPTSQPCGAQHMRVGNH